MINLSFVGIIVLGLGGSALALILHYRRSRRTVAEAACGQCGYAVKGLPSFTCPECGSDLREVGIATPALLPPSGPAPYIVLWTVLLPLPACLISGTVLSVLPKQRTVTESIALTLPRSAAYREIRLDARGKGYGEPVVLQDVTIRLSGNQGRSVTCDVNLRTLAYDDHIEWPPSTTRPAVFTVAVLLRWMNTAGVDPDDANVKAEAAELVGLIQATAGGAQMRNVLLTNFQGRTMGRRSSSQPSALLGWLTLGFWIAIWLAGVWYLLRRVRRRAASA